MKAYKRNKLNLVATLTALALAGPLGAEEGHDHKDHKGEAHTEHEGHDHAKLEAPNGGRILTEIHPHAELFVTDERKVRITILDENGEMVPVGEQDFAAVTGKRSSPIAMKFIEEDGILVSNEALPEGMKIPFILTYQAKPDGDKETIRMALNLADCPTCEHKEYACVCAHGEDGHEGHNH